VPQLCSFRDLIRRVRAGDQQAATDLVRQYEPAIHKAIRAPLVSLRLHRLLESADISQSVLANFFLRTTAGWFQLDDPEQLLKLLTTMARNQVRDEARRHQAECRDWRRLAPDASGESLDTLMDTGPTPSKIVAGHELVAEVYRRLPDEERELVEERVQGTAWAAIAAQRGDQPEALRKRLTRALDRVFHQLGLGKRNGR
jgi:DNA-directed RNA polymerase specialized sigma24 family protein